MTTVYFVPTDLRGREAGVLGERLIRAAAGEALGIDPGCVIICREANGKPYLAGSEGFHFNLSHTNGAVVLVVSDCPVGVDAEQIRPVNQRLAERFFSEREQLYLRSAEQSADQLFLEIWTRKEAFLKRSGMGIRVPLNSFCVLDEKNSRILHTRAHQGFILSCCCDPPENAIITVSPETVWDHPSARS